MDNNKNKGIDEKKWFDEMYIKTNKFYDWTLLFPIKRGVYPNSLTCKECGICCYGCSC